MSLRKIYEDYVTKLGIPGQTRQQYGGSRVQRAATMSLENDRECCSPTQVMFREIRWNTTVTSAMSLRCQPFTDDSWTVNVRLVF